MSTQDEAKRMAKRLRSKLATLDVRVTHAGALETIAAVLGYDDWNTAVASLPATAPERAAPPVGTVQFRQTVPILRSFDEVKAREFYCAFLGFQVDFEHRFEPGLPLYMQVSRAGLCLHLSEHHGDASPGSTVFVRMGGLRALHRELLDKHYRYGRPGIERHPWGEVVSVHDPFGNRIRFCEQEPTPADESPTRA